MTEVLNGTPPAGPSKLKPCPASKFMPKKRSSTTVSGMGKTGPVTSTCASSNELFGLFKALAAGRRDDSLEEDEEAVQLARQFSNLSAADQRQEAQSAQFAAVATSNLSPFGNVDSTVGELKHPKRPELPRTTSQALVSSPDSSDIEDESVASTTSDSDSLSDYRQESNTIYEQDLKLSDDEKVKAIIAEFGDIAAISDGGPERLLAESKGSLFKGVMMLGNLHLTTHRLLFHAVLPPDAVFIDAAEDTHKTSQLLRAGPVTIHTTGPLTRSRRVWMELGPEMITTYPKGDEEGRVRPIRAILRTFKALFALTGVSSIRHLSPLDPEHPCDLHLTYEGVDEVRKAHLTVDTEQSAILWRRSLETVLFRQARIRWREHEASKLGLNQAAAHEEHWAMMRICLPLDRARLGGVSDYHGFATLTALDVDLGVKSHMIWHPEILSEGDYPSSGETTPKRRGSSSFKLPLHFGKGNNSGSGHHSPDRRSPLAYIDTTLPRHLAAALSGTSTPQPFGSADKGSHIFDFNVAVLNEQDWFTKALAAAIDSSQGRVYKGKRPNMIMELAGSNCLATDEEMEAETPHDDVEDDDIGQRAHKEEKAAMAAKVFGLKTDEDIWLKRCYITGMRMPARGHIIVTPEYICFWRRAVVGSDIKYRFKTKDVKGTSATSSGSAGFHSMALHVHGQRDLHFDFWNPDSRDEVMKRINETCGKSQPLAKVDSAKSDSVIVDDNFYDRGTFHPADVLAPRKETFLQPKSLPDVALSYMPFIANRPLAVQHKLKPRTFTMLTIGSRGDVQPYIALGVRLKQDGHKVIIVTHEEFKKWIEGYGIEHRQAGGDPTALMKLSTEHKMFSPGFFKESLGYFRDWLDNLLLDSWKACHDADVLIESPSAMAGIHIAEALKIPYFRAFTMPWTRTSAYPQAFMVPAFEMGPGFNYSTYVLYDNIIWKATSGQINRWRRDHLSLESTDMSAMSAHKVPFLYNFSSAVVPKPLDWHDDITITGYWNLQDSDTDWSPPADLEAFMEKARDDMKPLVYIGFGSIVVPNPNAVSRSIIKGVQKADVRAIIAKGWSSRGADADHDGEEVVFPDNCYSLEKVPHGWLFPKIQAAMHHGGAGTVGATLRAGIPTLIKPWFGDQYFWANRMQKLQCGLRVPSLRSSDIAAAFIAATTDRVMIEKAARIGVKIREENGVDNAVAAISHNIVRAAADRTKM